MFPCSERENIVRERHGRARQQIRDLLLSLGITHRYMLYNNNKNKKKVPSEKFKDTICQVKKKEGICPVFQLKTICKTRKRRLLCLSGKVNRNKTSTRIGRRFRKGK